MKYIHRVQYYETDAQRVTHHSNYIRIMEEARVDMMEQMGFGYHRMEAEGVFSPVLGVTCDYKHATTFADEIVVTVRVAELGKLKLRLEYDMYVGDKLVCHATSLHCFLNAAGRPVVLEDRFPEFFHALQSWDENE